MTKRVAGNGYFELVRRFPLRPIRSESELGNAMTVVDDLISRKARSAEEDDYLDVLSTLVERYESEHHPIPDASPAEVLRFLMEDRQTNQRAVATGTRIAVSTVSQILSGQRSMNLDHMQKLAAHFGVEVSVFVPEQGRPKASTVRKLAAEPRRTAASQRWLAKPPRAPRKVAKHR